MFLRHMSPTPAAIPIKSFVVGSLTVEIFARLEVLAQAAAQAAQAHLQSALASNGSAAVVLAAAASQVKFLAALVDLDDVDWSRITLFHMDEYLGLPADHKASLGRFLRERMESRVKPRVFHYLAGDAALPIGECDRYEELLRTQPIDLCCLGIGENGHLAFNDPPVADFEDQHTVKIVKLDLKSRQQQVGEGNFPDVESVPPYAFTLTIPTLCAARKMICICPGKNKAQPVRDALKGPISTACPASILRRQAHAVLLLDVESASLL
jgi:glucosamine-6-phosphate deaminase